MLSLMLPKRPGEVISELNCFDDCLPLCLSLRIFGFPLDFSNSRNDPYLEELQREMRQLSLAAEVRMDCSYLPSIDSNIILSFFTLASFLTLIVLTVLSFAGSLSLKTTAIGF